MTNAFSARISAWRDQFHERKRMERAGQKICGQPVRAEPLWSCPAGLTIKQVTMNDDGQTMGVRLSDNSERTVMTAHMPPGVTKQ